MNTRILFLLFLNTFFALVQLPVNLFAQVSGQVDIYITNQDKSALLQKQSPLMIGNVADEKLGVIKINDTQKYQSMDGFGYALTGGSAMLINAMDAEARKQLLHELFARDENSIGVSYLRVSIGASDLSDRVFSYNDLPEGETDPKMEKFSLDTERKDLIPVLKQIIEINPDIKILGSPWSPPTWMKTNNKSIGGSLKPEFYDAYALYFVKYLEGMRAEGINIDAITVQNEPLHPGNNPSLLMLAAEQANFIKNNLGPAFRKANLDTKIIIYDHNADRTDYPLQILNDPEAREYIDGSAFHLYGGNIEALTEVHNAYPEKHLYFTEQWVGAPGNFANDLRWHIKTLIIGASRNWCRNVIEWNLAADPKQDPHTVGGCTSCLGAITIDGNVVVRNPAYYIIAHASKFVSPGSVRVESNVPEGLPNVAFKSPDGKMVMIVQNDSENSRVFQVCFNGQYVKTSIKGGAVATIIW